MQVKKDRDATQKAPAEGFTGDVYMDLITAPNEYSRTMAAVVHFAPGARTAWHTHPHGQTLYVTDGVGLIGRRGHVEEIRPGDIVEIAPDEDHWHGATPTNFMAHIAINEVYDGEAPVVWGEHVTDAEYTA